MKAFELRDRDVAELDQKFSELSKTQFDLRMRRATQQLQNTSQLKKMRRDIARVRAIPGQRESQK